ncbi:TPA: hypothetical protein I4G64_08255 [Enterobacter cloacae]|nr:hypothetical protein [Enterobacter pasteurii]
MNSTDADKLIDLLIGEAVLSLLKERGSVTSGGLIKRLRDMQAYETDPRRRETLATVIAEISSDTVAFNGRRTAQGRTEREGTLQSKQDNVVPLFGNGKPSDFKKIH